MSVTALFQLYAPFAGIAALCFWVGMLHQRVKTLETSAKRDREDGERLVRVETKLESVEEDVEKILRHMDGINRQLGNIMQRQAGKVIEFPAADI